MNLHRLAAVSVWVVFAFSVVLEAHEIRLPETKAMYRRMAPIDQYLMDRIHSRSQSSPFQWQRWSDGEFAGAKVLKPQ